MGFLPTLAFLVAFLAVLCQMAGIPLVGYLLVVVVVVLAVTALIMGEKDHPVSSRIAAVMAVLLSLSPLATPFVTELRIRQLEARRAKETAPTYQAIDAVAKGLGPLIDSYRQAAGYYPDFIGVDQPKIPNAQGQLVAQAPSTKLVPPADPFHPQKAPLRWLAVRDLGVMVVSVGQDGVTELALPGPPMDPAANPLAALASTGQDTRLATYDPTNGALGLGDVVRWHGVVDYGEAMAPLFTAWDEAARASVWRPTIKKRKTEIDPDPQSARDGLAAENLLKEGKHLAALALASRGLVLRDPYEAQWKPGDKHLNRTRGVALYFLGAFRAGADALVLHLGNEPNDAMAHYYTAACLYYGGNRDAAMLHCAAAAQIDPASPFADTAWQRSQELTRGGQVAFPRVEPWAPPKAADGQNEQPAP